jgi:hypothetical protein
MLALRCLEINVYAVVVESFRRPYSSEITASLRQPGRLVVGWYVYVYMICTMAAVIKPLIISVGLKHSRCSHAQRNWDNAGVVHYSLHIGTIQLYGSARGRKIYGFTMIASASRCTLFFQLQLLKGRRTHNATRTGYPPRLA